MTDEVDEAIEPDEKPGNWAIRRIWFPALLVVGLVGFILFYAMGSGSGSSMPGGQGQDLASQSENSAAFESQLDVVHAIISCHGIADVGALRNIDRDVLEIPALYPPRPDDPDYRAASGEGDAGRISLTALDRMIVSLNFRLRQERVRTAAQASNATAVGQWLQFWVIVLGMGTTILAGLNTLWSGADRQTWQKAALQISTTMVVMVSAAGAALSSYVAYISPAATIAVQQQRLAQLRSLHQSLLNTTARYYGPPLCPMDASTTELQAPDSKQAQDHMSGNGDAKANPFIAAYWGAFAAVDKIAEDFEATYPISSTTSDERVGDPETPNRQPTARSTVMPANGGPDPT